MGQTTTIFYQNVSFFFVVREECADGPGRTALLSTFGAFCSENRLTSPILARPVAYMDITAPLENINIAWDHACNVVVISPGKDSNEFITNQVSFYDGQQRFQRSYTLQSSWRKVPGVGALDHGSATFSWNPPQEWYCGDNCLFHTLEEQLIDGVPQLPRYLVGRSYRTTAVVMNYTDSVQVKSLTYNPYCPGYAKVSQFIGIGQCCSQSWCHSDCAAYGEDLVLISFVPSMGLSILAGIGPLDAKTIMLGVEFTPAPYNPVHQIYVWHDDTILTYNVLEQNYVIVTAKLSVQSPPVSGLDNIVMWANAGFI